MHRSAAINMIMSSQFLAHQTQTQLVKAKQMMRIQRLGPCDVFINHRCRDTKKTIASLLYDHLLRHNLRPFLDSKNMKPGDKLFDKIDGAIKHCKIGLALFSPRYCDSYFCLHELALLLESNKKIIPIFCDVKPSQLRVPDNGKCGPQEIGRFRWALEEAKYTVGMTYDSSKGNLSEVVTNAGNAVIKSLMEMDHEDQKMYNRKI